MGMLARARTLFAAALRAARSSDFGATAVEYGILVALVGLGSLGGATLLLQSSKAEYQASETRVGDPKSACIGDEVLVNGVCGPNPMVISAVSPSFGGTSGAYSVTITGVSFVASPPPTVTFDGADASVQTVTSSSIVVTAPAGTLGPADVTVKNNDSTAYQATKFSGFTYAQVPGAPAAPSVAPAGGNASIGWAAPVNTGSLSITEYTLQRSTDGINFGNDQIVTGTNYVWTGLLNGTPYYFRVKAKNGMGYGPYSPASLAATPQATPPSAPIITSITPGAQQLSVLFTPPASDGGASVTNYQYSLNGGAWAQLVPASTASPLVIGSLGINQTYVVQIRADNGVPTGQASNTVTQTTLGPPPAISNVAPSSGPASATTPITITGTGFVSGAQVTVGGTLAVVTSVTATEILATAPAKAAGSYDVVVTNPDGQSDPEVGGFTYTVPLSISSCPATGNSNGGYTGTITGTGFLGTPTVPSVSFGGVSATPVVWNSATQLTVTVPPRTTAPRATSVTVTVTNAGGQSATCTFTYTQAPAPTISTVAPRYGLKTSTTPITITGSGYASGATVTVGGNPATGVNVSGPSSITAQAPAGTGTDDVVVTNPDGQTATSVGAFRYFDRIVTSNTSSNSASNITVTPSGGSLVSSAFAAVSLWQGAAQGYAYNNTTRINFNPIDNATGQALVTFNYRVSSVTYEGLLVVNY